MFTLKYINSGRFIGDQRWSGSVEFGKLDLSGSRSDVVYGWSGRRGRRFGFAAAAEQRQNGHDRDSLRPCDGRLPLWQLDGRVSPSAILLSKIDGFGAQSPISARRLPFK